MFLSLSQHSVSHPLPFLHRFETELQESNLSEKYSKVVHESLNETVQNNGKKEENEAAQACGRKEGSKSKRRGDTFASINMQIRLTLIIRKLCVLFDVARLTAPLSSLRADESRVGESLVVSWFYQDRGK